MKTTELYSKQRNKFLEESLNKKETISFRRMKLLIKLILMAFLSLIPCSNIKAETINVCTKNELKYAIEAINPGGVILLCDGVWSDLKLQIAKNGTALAPITIKAKNLGKVIISGNSYINLAGSYIHIRGFRWEDYGSPAPYKSYIHTDSGSFKCTISEMVFKESMLAPFPHWIYSIALRGKEHEVFNTAFLGKYGRGAQLKVQEGGKDLKHKLHHLYFSRKPLVDNQGELLNGGESLQIGAGDGREDDADNVIAHHLFFENASGEGEIISVKGSFNSFADIVMVGCEGFFSLRLGNDNLIKNLFVDAEDKKKRFGFLFYGDRHRVKNVFIKGIRSKGRGGLYFKSGYFKHDPSDDVLIENLTIMDSYDAIKIGTTNKLHPTNIKFNNVIAVSKTHNSSVLVVKNPRNAYSFSNSCLYGGMNVLQPAGTQNIDPLLIEKSDGLFVPRDDSPFYNKGSQMTKMPVYKHQTGPQGYVWYEAEDAIVSMGSLEAVNAGDELVVAVAYKASENRKITFELQKGSSILDSKYIPVNKGANTVNHTFMIPSDAVDADNYKIVSFITTVTGGFKQRLDEELNPLEIIETPSTGYCSSKATTTTGADFIYSFRLNNSAIHNESYDLGASGYTEHTTISGNLSNTNTVVVRRVWRPSFLTATVSVWIDYNHNNTFEASEKVGSKTGAIDYFTFDFSVPSGAISGATRMRVVMQEGSAASPCGDFAVGEVEDYTVNWFYPN